MFTAIHLPLYLPGQLYDDLPLWPVFLTLMGYAVLLACMYDGSGRSSLLAGITHAGVNGFVPLTAGLDKVWVWEARGIVFALIGIAVLGRIALRPMAARADLPQGNASTVGDRGSSIGTRTPDEARAIRLARPTGVRRAHAHLGFRQILIEGADEWRSAALESA